MRPAVGLLALLGLYVSFCGIMHLHQKRMVQEAVDKALAGCTCPAQP